jgi:hypothetical protein
LSCPHGEQQAGRERGGEDGGAGERGGGVAGVGGQGVAGTLDQLDVGALRACLEVNVVGTWLACREAARPMRSAG